MMRAALTTLVIALAAVSLDAANYKCVKTTEPGGKTHEQCEACNPPPPAGDCPFANMTACEKVCHHAPAPPPAPHPPSPPAPPHPPSPPKPTTKYVCNLEMHRCEEGDFVPAFPSLMECESECKAPEGFICGKESGTCERSNSSKITAAECEKTCKPEVKHYKCDETTARCVLSTLSKDTMEECAHACKPKPTHGYECNATLHRCVSVPGGKHAGNLTACDKECVPKEKGYTCNHETKRCEQSEESKESMEECAHHCSPEQTHGYECNKTAHRCESVPNSGNKNLTLCEHMCKPEPPPAPEQHGFACNDTLKTCERSMESKHTIAECEAGCHHTAAHGYACNARLKKCVSTLGAAQKNYTLCEAGCKA